VAGKIVIPR